MKKAVIVVLILVIGGFFMFSKNKDISETPITENSSQQVNIYQNSIYGFSITLSGEMLATEFEESGGDTILIKDSTYQMQIRITPFDEDIVLTKERIKKDIPDIKMENPEAVSIDGTEGVTFTSDTDGTRYKEVWFVRGGYLYQTLSLASGDEVTNKIISGWKWSQ